jgi:hypothetical protein
MSANINVNLNRCELTPSAEQSVHGEFIWLVNGVNTDKILDVILIYSALWTKRDNPSLQLLIDSKLKEIIDEWIILLMKEIFSEHLLCPQL